MAETESKVSPLLQTETHLPNDCLRHLLDPISLILHQNSDSHEPFPLRLTTDSYFMERGPRYREYAELREVRLRMRMMIQQELEEVVHDLKLTPPKKQVKFQVDSNNGRKVSSVVAQSVPDFSAVLRKENRKPVNTLPSMLEMTPPSKSLSKGNGVLSNSRGSKSANAGEKRRLGGGLTARKSYASFEELKDLSSLAANAINVENRGGRSGKSLMGKNILGYRQFR